MLNSFNHQIHFNDWTFGRSYSALKGILVEALIYIFLKEIIVSVLNALILDNLVVITLIDQS